MQNISIKLALVFGLLILGLISTTKASAQGCSHDCTWTEWTATSSCVANSCGTSEGTQNERRTCEKTECDYTCPVIHFEWTTQSCPSGYDEHGGRCRQWDWTHWHYHYADMVNTNHSADVAYNKSSDPHKCHRPSDDTLRDVYGMNNNARNEFKRINHEWEVDAERTNCHQVVERTQTREGVACNDAEVITCEEQTPVCTDETALNYDSEVGENEYSDHSVCEYSNDDPTEPSTPSGEIAKTSGSHVDVHCDGGMSVRMNLSEGNSTPEGITVRFTYRNETKEAKTNSEGVAEVGYTYSGDENVKIEADGYPSQYPPVKSAENCAAGNVLGASTEGKVLGASTMAATGSSLMSLIGMIGTAVTLVAAVIYAKKA